MEQLPQPGIWGSSRKQEKTVSTAARRSQATGLTVRCVEHVGHMSVDPGGAQASAVCLTEPAVVFTK